MLLFGACGFLQSLQTHTHRTESTGSHFLASALGLFLSFLPLMGFKYVFFREHCWGDFCSKLKNGNYLPSTVFVCRPVQEGVTELRLQDSDTLLLRVVKMQCCPSLRGVLRYCDPRALSGSFFFPSLKYHFRWGSAGVSRPGEL